MAGRISTVGTIIQHDTRVFSRISAQLWSKLMNLSFFVISSTQNDYKNQTLAHPRSRTWVSTTFGLTANTPALGSRQPNSNE